MGRGVTDTATPSPGERLGQIATDYWEHLAETAPTSALLRGDHRYMDRWEDTSRQAEDATISALSGFADAAAAIDPASLTPDERITRATLIAEARGASDVLRHRPAEFAVDHSTSGIHVTLLQFVPMIRIADAGQATALVTKWSRVPELMDQTLKRLRQGVARGRTPNQLAVERSIAQLDDYLGSDIDDDPFLQVPAPESMTEAERAAWRARLREQVEAAVRPGFAAYRTALADEVLEKARPVERPGLRWIEDGEAAYAAEIRRHTSLDLAPLDIHQIGLDEIERLGDAYRDLGKRVLDTSDLPTIYERLRNDPDLRFETPEQIVAAAQVAMDRARTAIPHWFGRLPQADCVMAEMGVSAEDSTIAYYLPPAADGSRPGTYLINTTEPTTRTRFESEVLAFHESIPGHHLQIAIAQELEEIPEFRKHALMTAYVEGWGLYVERLSDEMGLYSDDLSRLGILSFDSWRAGRLVVDTGIHALGWSRQEAIDYLVANSPQAPNNIANEVDRYIAMPGQALAYKLGQRAIMRLRKEAEETMGDRFDIKAFHDTVLGSGPVTLEILDELVRTWAAA
jgi:uncharacterized protein (DUF885 family)